MDYHAIALKRTGMDQEGSRKISLLTGAVHVTQNRTTVINKNFYMIQASGLRQVLPTKCYNQRRQKDQSTFTCGGRMDSEKRNFNNKEKNFVPSTLFNKIISIIRLMKTQFQLTSICSFKP